MVPCPRSLLSPRQNLLTRTIDSCAAVFGFACDLLSHARYRRAELRRLPAVDPPSGSYRMAEPVGPRRGQPTLVGRPPLRVGYDVMLPEGAIVRSWCSLAPESDGSPPAETAFSIEVRTTGAVTSVRRVVRGRSLHREWHLLEARAPASGPARITLDVAATNESQQAPGGARWGNAPHRDATAIRRIAGAASGSDRPGRILRGSVKRILRPTPGLRSLGSRASAVPPRAPIAAGMLAWAHAAAVTLHLRRRRRQLATFQDGRGAARTDLSHWEWLLVVSRRR